MNKYNRFLYEKIIRDVSVIVKKHIKEFNENLHPINKTLLENISNIDLYKLEHTRQKNLRMFRYITEANGEDLIPIRNDILNGNSPFGKHHYKKLDDDINLDSSKECIVAFQNAWSNFHEFYQFDDWQYVFAHTDKIYYMDFLVPNDKEGLDVFLNKLKS